ncbi:MAG TPA: MetQ/NlpA family ABC transporter substrate-binding protein [Bacillota bacterium]|jgi:D-methionine transport system substrate-binding protein|nr:MetQ/NlpA family ABC transporter substrate-binding protein [Bacillota bacterium]HPZ58946.1 MetQ/NlpA family ABC transporter substrate-binding protein [Bacillota bacterium]HQC82705.1 MetQ/NlpA family ABC transporter substrate-binding protein [Bacillota bacterium]
MKKILSLLLISILALSLFTGCGGGEAEEPEAELQKIIVGASPAPHAEILEIAKELLVEQGYDLQIQEFVDYVQPNLALDSGEIDANYFQHRLYLDQFNVENGTEIVAIADVHYEPFGIYPGRTSSLDDLTDGSQIAVPNDTTNEARALLLLEYLGLIKLRENVGLEATVNDIVENPKNLKIVEIEAAQLPRSLPDVDMAVINGNYAIDAGLNVGTDALAIEDAESPTIKTYYSNVLAVKVGNEDREDLQALAAALLSPEVKAFIESTYEGAVVPMF